MPCLAEPLPCPAAQPGRAKPLPLPNPAPPTPNRGGTARTSCLPVLPSRLPRLPAMPSPAWPRHRDLAGPCPARPCHLLPSRGPAVLFVPVLPTDNSEPAKRPALLRTKSPMPNLRPAFLEQLLHETHRQHVIIDIKVKRHLPAIMPWAIPHVTTLCRRNDNRGDCQLKICNRLARIRINQRDSILGDNHRRLVQQILRSCGCP